MIIVRQMEGTCRFWKGQLGGGYETNINIGQISRFLYTESESFYQILPSNKLLS